MKPHFKEHTMQTYFAKNLKDHLKEMVKGSVHCTITSDDQLIVKIYASNDIVYWYKLECMSDKIYTGLTSETLSHTIVKWYRRYINNLFFM